MTPNQHVVLLILMFMSYISFHPAKNASRIFHAITTEINPLQCGDSGGTFM